MHNTIYRQTINALIIYKIHIPNPLLSQRTSMNKAIVNEHVD